MGLDDRDHEREEGGFVHRTFAAVGESWVGGPFGVGHGGGAFDEQAVVAGGDADGFVGGFEGLVGDQQV